MNDEKPVCINRPGFCIFGCIKLVTNNAHVVTKNLRRNIWGFFFVHPVRFFFKVVFKPTSNIVLG